MTRACWSCWRVDISDHQYHHHLQVDSVFWIIQDTVFTQYCGSSTVPSWMDSIYIFRTSTTCPGFLNANDVSRPLTITAASLLHVLDHPKHVYFPGSPYFLNANSLSIRDRYCCPSGNFFKSWWRTFRVRSFSLNFRISDRLITLLFI